MPSMLSNVLCTAASVGYVACLLPTLREHLAESEHAVAATPVVSVTMGFAALAWVVAALARPAGDGSAFGTWLQFACQVPVMLVIMACALGLEERRRVRERMRVAVAASSAAVLAGSYGALGGRCRWLPEAVALALGLVNKAARARDLYPILAGVGPGQPVAVHAVGWWLSGLAAGAWALSVGAPPVLLCEKALDVAASSANLLTWCVVERRRRRGEPLPSPRSRDAAAPLAKRAAGDDDEEEEEDGRRGSDDDARRAAERDRVAALLLAHAALAADGDTLEAPPAAAPPRPRLADAFAPPPDAPPPTPEAPGRALHSALPAQLTRRPAAATPEAPLRAL